MKRLLSILLAAIFLFCACGVNHTEESSLSDESSFDEASSPDESSKEEILPPPTEVFTDVSVSADRYETMITVGKTYTVTKEADEPYPDTYNRELTDGKIDTSVSAYWHESLSGYAVRTQYVIIDLGDYYRNIHTLAAAYYVDGNAGISTELKINTFLSLDGEEWENCGYLITDDLKLQTVNIGELRLENYANARYIKFTISGNASWIFLQELYALADVEDKSNVSYLKALNETYASLGTVSAPKNGKEIDYNLDKINIAKDKSYTVDTAPNENYVDVDGIMLTDGKGFGNLSAENWVGFDGGKEITVKIDLGETIDDISSVEASFYVSTSSSIYLPTALKINSIDDSENRTELGVVYGNANIKDGNFIFVLPFEKCISARYIEVIIYTAENSVVLVEEISVYSRCVFDTNVYPDVVIEKGGEVDRNAKDEYTNLILGKTQQIYSILNIGDAGSENNSPVTDKTLTDGVFSKNYNIHNGQFFKFYLGTTRNIIYDLDYVSSVDKFTASFCHEEGWAMFAPETVTIYASADGENWFALGEMKPEPIKEIDGIYRCELQLPKSVLARYVAFSFDVNMWAGIDELQVFGNKAAGNAVSMESQGYQTGFGKSGFDDPADVKKRKEPSEDLLGGARQLSLLYHSPNNCYTENDLLPYVAYLDKDGNIVDTMFDSFLFLHDTGAMPSGNSPYKGSTWADWQWALEDLFVPGENLYALESAAGKVKSALNLPDDFTYKVTMTVYYPPVATSEYFGDYNGDGIDDDFSDYKTRIRAIKAYIDQIEKRFAEAGFKNIELVGYYWWHEDITSTPEDDIVPLLNDISDYIHTKDKDFFWIPYYTAPGFSHWEEYGFDIACMQPNYAFSPETPITNLINNEKYTRYYGMGFEMEISENSIFDSAYFKHYMDYMRYGAETGYMTDTVNMYYQSYFVFRDACYSESAMARMIYDVTYEYIKGTLDPKPKQLANMSFDAQSDNISPFQIDYNTEQPIEIQLISMPDHGSVTFGPDGSFDFYPEHGFKGETSFTFAYSEYLAFSDPIKVTVKVN